MAIESKGLVYGGREGSGAAQIFDTRGASKWEVAKIEQQAQMDAQKKERKKKLLEDLEIEVEAGSGWGVDQRLYDAMHQKLIDEQVQLRIDIKNSDRVTPDLLKRKGALEKKESMLNSLTSYSLQHKKTHDSGWNRYSDNSEKYEDESRKRLAYYKNPDVELDYKKMNDWEYLAGTFAELVDKRSQINEAGLVLAKPEKFDFIEFQDNMHRNIESMTAKIDKLLGDTTETNFIPLMTDVQKTFKNAYLSDETMAAWYNEEYGDDINGFEDMTSKEKAEALSRTDEAMELLLPGVVKKIKTKSNFTFSMGDKYERNYGVADEPYWAAGQTLFERRPWMKHLEPEIAKQADRMYEKMQSKEYKNALAWGGTVAQDDVAFNVPKESYKMVFGQYQGEPLAYKAQTEKSIPVEVRAYIPDEKRYIKDKEELSNYTESDIEWQTYLTMSGKHTPSGKENYFPVEYSKGVDYLEDRVRADKVVEDIKDKLRGLLKQSGSGEQSENGTEQGELDDIF